MNETTETDSIHAPPPKPAAHRIPLLERFTRLFFDRTVHAGRVMLDWREHPELVRRALRDSTPGQILACGSMGLGVGTLIVLLHRIIAAAHSGLFLLPLDERLSGADEIPTIRVLLIPVLGGVAIGLIRLLWRTLKLHDIVDPIEANAVHGGRLSVLDSLRLVFASLVTTGCGLSVGMEAAYSQLGGTAFSFGGRVLRLRREDMRIFVAAGTAAAIAAAFNAPLAGAFYGFELILGVYTISAISQVAVAALCGTLVARLLLNGDAIFSLPMETTGVPDWYYGLFFIQGIGAALVGILTMIAVTRCEQAASKLSLPDWLRPVLGGLLVGGIALVYPEVLGSGLGAIAEHMHQNWPILVLLTLMLAKIATSAISLGSGFYGGLFATSLFIGCLFGQMFGLFAGHFLPAGAEHLDIFMVVGIGSVAASVVGAPVTMVLMMLEMTSNFTATTAVLMGVLISSAITRYFFGYSFSTWRFHLRGMRISGAHDIGWVQELTVASLMRHDAPVIDSAMPRDAILERAVHRSNKRLFVAGPDARYLGMIDGNSLTEDEKPTTAAELATWPERYLLPHQNIQQALYSFTAWETEELPVLDSIESRLVIGYLSEAYSLRRYAHELESRTLAKLSSTAPSNDD